MQILRIGILYDIQQKELVGSMTIEPAPGYSPITLTIPEELATALNNIVTEVEQLRSPVEDEVQVTTRGSGSGEEVIPEAVAFPDDTDEVFIGGDTIEGDWPNS